MSEILKQLLEMKARLDAVPKPEFDCLVCLPEGYEQLRRVSEEVGVPADPLTGFPVYLYQTVVEVRELVRKLEEEGKKPALFGAGLKLDLSWAMTVPTLPIQFLADVPGPAHEEFRHDVFTRKEIDSARERLWAKQADEASGFVKQETTMDASETARRTVRRYNNGNYCGEVQRDKVFAVLHDARKHPDFQWPEGVARAGNVLSEDELEACGVDAEDTIFLE